MGKFKAVLVIVLLFGATLWVGVWFARMFSSVPDDAYVQVINATNVSLLTASVIHGYVGVDAEVYGNTEGKIFSEGFVEGGPSFSVVTLHSSLLYDGLGGASTIYSTVVTGTVGDYSIVVSKNDVVVAEYDSISGLIRF